MKNETMRIMGRVGAYALLASALLGVWAERALADGDETLGPPSIPVAMGTGVIAAGTGLIVQPGTIDVTVPSEATVEQVLLYWEGFGAAPQFDDTIVVGGIEVTGTLIGGPDFVFSDRWSSTFRADVTDLGLIDPGANSVTVDGLSFNRANNGSGFLVIIDDGSGVTEIDLRDGNDTAFINDSPPRDTTVPQVYSFEPADVDRIASLAMFFSSVQGSASGAGPFRPSTILVTIDGFEQEFNNLLASVDGEEWDSVNIDNVAIPAGATSLTVQALSEDREGTGNLPASFVWSASALFVPPPPPRGTIGDFVWEDCNGNGIQDDADIPGCELGSGIPGVPVELRNDECTGELVASTTTGLAGDYLFTDLPPGAYCVVFPDPADALDCGSGSTASYTLKNAGDPANDSNANPDGTTDPIGLAAGESNLTIDAGVFCTVRIGDTLWNDLNRNGIQDMLNDGMGEPGVNDVTVTLFDCDGNQVGEPTTTGAAPADAAPPQIPGGAGWYQFDGLVPGCYVVQFDQPAGFVFSPANQGGDPALDSNVNPMGATDPINLVSRDSDQTVDAGINRPPTAGLGDFVFEDKNANGIQDPDEPGIPGVPVMLLENPDQDSSCDSGDEMAVGSTQTDEMGMYMFEDLEPGDYCVKFDKSVIDCTTDNFLLGAPAFSPDLEGNDPAVDSNPDPATGVTGNVNLGPDEFDPTIDAGIFCPAKLGDRVFKDCNGNGIQDDEGLPGCESELGIPDVTVKLFDCEGNPIEDENGVQETRVTDAFGFYMFGGEPGVFDLKPGEYVAQFDPSTFPPDFMFSPVGQGGNDALDSDCMPPGGETACTPLGSRGINLNRDCGLIPPPPLECGLVLDKTCRVEADPPSGDLECEAKIAATVLLYIGQDDPNEVTVTGKNDKATVISSFDDGILTIDARPEDLGSKMTITTDGVAEVIHTSCSTPYVAGQPAPLDNPKGDPSPNWFVVSFVDKEGNSVSIPDDGEGGFTDECSFTAEPLPSCDNGPKPDTLTWRYDGGTGGDGDCEDSTFFTIVNEDGKPHKDFECTGSVNTSQPITAVDKDGNAFVVNPGESFTTRLDDSQTISLSNLGGTQELVFHTSCSQPLEAGATAGALTLAALDDRDGVQEVTYRYEVTNVGDLLTGVTVTDDQLGDIASIALLGMGESQTFTQRTQLVETTTNTATATGTLSDDGMCVAQDSVTVTAVEPTCNVSIAFEKLDKSKIEWKLTNDSAFGKATLQTFKLGFPASLEVVDKVELNGGIYKADDSDACPDGVNSDEMISDAGNGCVWTEDKVKNRQIELEKTETLKVEFEGEDENATLNEFDLTLTFEEGCMVEFVDGDPKVVEAEADADAVDSTWGLGGCSAAPVDPEDRFGLLLFAGALLLWAKRRRRTVGSAE